MFKKGIIKYMFIIVICFSIFIYGFIEVNINKPELVKEKSKFTINLKLNPVDFRIETNAYVFYANGKIFYNMKEKCIDTYNDIFMN
ncbi:hypothetical protein KPL37_10115 [Clostridium frigoris]|uniref:Uncharacterized protein n=1 Tax=Clostridium frigoris TaxID=205327 RepID=A0ABS6BW66_9CLOT|nr:hypothetical protein [Clostridium frigoris]MBU3160108.1 hypothetical protein [Clostridium frigoris]